MKLLVPILLLLCSGCSWQCVYLHPPEATPSQGGVMLDYVDSPQWQAWRNHP